MNSCLKPGVIHHKIADHVAYAADAPPDSAGKIGKLTWVIKLPFSPPAWGCMIEWEDEWPLSVGASSRVLERVE